MYKYMLPCVQIWMSRPGGQPEPQRGRFCIRSDHESIRASTRSVSRRHRVRTHGTWRVRIRLLSSRNIITNKKPILITAPPTAAATAPQHHSSPSDPSSPPRPPPNRPQAHAPCPPRRHRPSSRAQPARCCLSPPAPSLAQACQTSWRCARSETSSSSTRGWCDPWHHRGRRRVRVRAWGRAGRYLCAALCLAGRFGRRRWALRRCRRECLACAVVDGGEVSQ